MTHPPAGFQLDDIVVSYASGPALDGVSLSIEPGETLAVVGPSGAGKTTLLRLLGGGQRPSSGSVTAAGTQLSALSPMELRRFRSSVGVVHQDLALVPNLRVYQNVVSGQLGQMSLAASLAAYLMPSHKRLADVHRILERVGIGDKLYQRTDRLSGGERQRVAIARALYQEPVALLADEPVSSVDPARARDTLELLTGLAREQTLTLCVSLHNLELARELFPRLVGLRAGCVVFDGPPTSLSHSDFDSLFELDADLDAPVKTL